MSHTQSLPNRYARTLIVLAIVLATAGTGCTPFSNFNRECACAARHRGPDPAGCWEGCWASHTTPHKGKLNAVITRCDACHYHIRFHTTFFKIFQAEYEIDVTGYDRGDGVYVFSGQKDLGKVVGGVFTFNGTTTATDFHATYRSCKDHGVFVMKRKVASTCCK
jgi:hypothetical protein